MLPNDEMAAIHRAMTTAVGDRGKAAQALGLTEAELIVKIRQSPELTTLWLSSRVVLPKPEEAYSRETQNLELVEPVDWGGVPPVDEAKARALADEEQKLQKFDWEGLGLREEKTIQLMRSFESGVGRGVVRLLDAMCGGMGYCFAQVSARFAYAAEQLERKEVQNDPALYSHWHEIFISCAKEMKGFNREATAAAHTRLLIADKAKKMQVAADKLRKPGWKTVKPAAAPASNGGEAAA